ncbi:hypothetical protein BJ741DRAFT_711553 [Chytriomyces cf. hyalinus JEL632]|nr:hypothetical protein BJ741DRAFT_711553 [Chytriomyces cf. hyalinus JEL632]
MPATLFGELEISKSHGHAPVNTPQHIAPTVLCYVSGNTFNFADTRSAKLFAHDSLIGGVKNIAIARDAHEIRLGTHNGRTETDSVGRSHQLNQGRIQHELQRLFKVKKDEIMKIDDKNDRIATIMAESAVQTGADEVPERMIEVNDSEVHAEKFIGPEELRRIEAQKREEEDRRRAAQEDNYRERGVMIMMGGKLDDRSEETEKEELIRPENKPREEMNEKKRENDKLELRLRDLEAAVKERRKIHDVQVMRKTMAGAVGGSGKKSVAGHCNSS